MKLLLENRKIFIIIAFVLVCGVILHFSRSNVVLHSVQNSDIDTQFIDLQNTVNNFEVIANPMYCIVFTNESVKLKDNIIQTLQYMQKNYKTFDAQLGKVNYEDCENILLATSYLHHLGTIEEIETFVQTGGQLFLMQTLEPDSHFQSLYRHFGIVNYNGFGITNGLKMTSNVLLGTKDKTFLTELLNDSSLNITLDNGIPVYIRSTTDKPILWRASFGDGQIMVFNAHLLSEKTSRGLIAGILSLMDDTFIYPIFNAKTFYIDDFPAPIAKGKNEIIFNEYKQDLPTFYRNIWWPDMLQIASRYNLIYTGALIETYNDRVTPPFTTQKNDDFNTLISYGRELIQNNGEIGIHGYNHQSLTMDASISTSFGYNSWQSVEDMKAALSELHSYVKSAFPSYEMTSYVPPSNVLSEEGRITLKKVIPTIAVIASLYSEDESNRGYIQEFDIGEDQIINMPRISSGYYRTDTNEWEIANAMTMHGVFSHFIHPDDVISTDRSKGSWSEMFEEFEDFMQEIDERYPWLRAFTATEAAYAQVATLQSKIRFEQTDDVITGTIEHFSAPQHFILRSQHKIKKSVNCTVEKIEENTYLVIADESQFTIQLKRDAS